MTELMEVIRAKHLSRGHFQGLLHILIGRRIVGPGGAVVSTGMTFRDLANLLRKIRWDPDQVQELGLDPASLPVRDRQRYWFSAICQAKVDGADAKAAADRLIPLLRPEGYEVGPPPGKPG